MKGRMTILGSCLLALLLLLSCAPGGGPEAAAKTAFEQWAQQNGVPYKDARFQTLNNNGVFAAVRITAMFKQHIFTSNTYISSTILNICWNIGCANNDELHIIVISIKNKFTTGFRIIFWNNTGMRKQRHRLFIYATFR